MWCDTIHVPVSCGMSLGSLVLMSISFSLRLLKKDFLVGSDVVRSSSSLCDRDIDFETEGSVSL